VNRDHHKSCYIRKIRHNEYPCLTITTETNPLAVGKKKMFKYSISSFLAAYIFLAATIILIPSQRLYIPKELYPKLNGAVFGSILTSILLIVIFNTLKGKKIMAFLSKANFERQVSDINWMASTNIIFIIVL
jgi:hypothetical protein